MDDVQAFFSEVERGDVETVRAMVAAAPRLVHARDTTGATALHVAALNGHRALVELLARLVTRHPALASATDRDGTPLAEHAAVVENPEIATVFARARAERD